MGDFNSQPNDNVLKEFLELFSFKNLVKEPTCYKNPHNPRLIDLIITNRPKMFQNTINVETGLSDFHMMTVTVLKTSYKKCKPKLISYRDYKHFSNDNFRHELMPLLRNERLSKALSNDNFIEIVDNLLLRHLPLKYQYVRANDSPFMNKELRKAVMLRSRLRNIFNKNKTDSAKAAYKKQRNICTSLFRKAKSDYYSNLNTNSITDNKKFWKTVKPLFSEKVMSAESITIVENDTIYNNGSDVSQIFNQFFSNVVKNLNILPKDDVINDNVNDLDIINHPSILKIKEVFGNQDIFSFVHCSYEDALQEIRSLNSSKAWPETSIPPTIIKDEHSTNNKTSIPPTIIKDEHSTNNKTSIPPTIRRAFHQQ